MIDHKPLIIDVLRNAIAEAAHTWLKASHERKRRVAGSLGLVDSVATFPSPDPFGIRQAAKIEREAGKRLQDLKDAYEDYIK